MGDLGNGWSGGDRYRQNGPSDGLGGYQGRGGGRWQRSPGAPAGAAPAMRTQNYIDQDRRDAEYYAAMDRAGGGGRLPPPSGTPQGGAAPGMRPGPVSTGAPAWGGSSNYGNAGAVSQGGTAATPNPSGPLVAGSGGYAANDLSTTQNKLAAMNAAAGLGNRPGAPAWANANRGNAGPTSQGGTAAQRNWNGTLQAPSGGGVSYGSTDLGGGPATGAPATGAPASANAPEGGGMVDRIKRPPKGDEYGAPRRRYAPDGGGGYSV